MYSTQPWVAGLATALFVTFPASAWENLPQKPYGQADLLPAQGQFVITPYYSYTRWLHFYDGKGDKRVIPQELSEEDFEVNDGMVNFEYGISRNLALDLTLGLTTGATRFFDVSNEPHTDWGMMDTQVGVRYRIVDEAEQAPSGMPTLTVRLGGIIAGTYQSGFPFAPGSGGSGGEVGFFANKKLGDYGVNTFADMSWRFRNHDIPVKVQTRLGLYYAIPWETGALRMFTPHVGYKFLNSFGGSEVSGNGPDLQYSADVRERAHILDSGIGITDQAGRELHFYFDWGFSGENTPAVMTYGLYLSFPFGGKK